MYRISIIMAIYNEKIEWMRQSIDSILNQTFSDFEFIIINDNPQMRDNQLLTSEYVKKDKRIKKIHNEQLTKSLNKGLKIAEGQYIARLNADDIALPKRFEKQVYFEGKCLFI
ncbi:glycosyltransferase family 2 protein [Capnocytophaga canimorsus]|uniref:glycosyltransferase family 2 protein n=1 Tax=Capnocytophaga canimorsus TaxID=28188 RepID=UPI0037D9842F